MAQKSILSFFKQTDKSLLSNKSENNGQCSLKSKLSSTDTPKESAELDESIQKEGSTAGCSNSSKTLNGFKPTDNESPVKQTRKRKARLLDSDEESNQSHEEVSNHVKNESDKMDVDAGSEVEDDHQSNEDSSSSSTKLNGKLSPSKEKSLEEHKNDDVQSSSKKIKLEHVSPLKSEALSDISDSALNTPSSSLKDLRSSQSPTSTSQLPPPPKRITARKSMNSSGTIAISSSSEESKDSIKNSIFPNVKTYEKKNVKKESKIAEESSPDEIKSTEEIEKEVKIKSEESEESIQTTEKISSPKKSHNIHPFFVRKNKETSSQEEKVVEKNKPEDTVEKNESSSENESSSPASKKGKKRAINKNSSKKSSTGKSKKESHVKSEEVLSAGKSNEKGDSEGKAQKSGDNNNSSSGNESSPDASMKNKEKPNDEEKVKDSLKEKSGKKILNSSSTSSGVHYDPSKSKYHPIEDACWKRSEKVPYLALAKTLELIENTSARLKIVEILANYFRSVIVLTPDDLLQSVYLCLNRIAPEYEGIELGVGDMVLMKGVAQATGRTLDKIRAEVKEKGDLGLVAESSRGNQKVMFAPPKLTVTSVFSKFKEIAQMSGNAAMAKKTDKIQALFVACRDCEAKYIIRSLSGKLRIGLAEQSVLAALGRAAVLTPPSQSYPPEVLDKSSGMSSEKFKKLQDAKTLILKTTYCECPNYDLVIPVLLKEGIDSLPEHCQLSPGCPLKPMLAHPTAGIDEVLQRFDNNEFTCEFKYDGERAQIHRNDKGEIKIFSRNQEENTSKYPDIIARISKALKDTTISFILDTESVAWDREAQQILPFQILSTRKKKDAVESEIVVQVCVMAFDLLYLNGESLVKKPLKERRALLHSSFVEVPNELMFVTYKDGNSAETMQEFLDESIKGNCEGLMVKALEVDASYEIAKRSHNWLKLKKDYLDGVGDTLDLVVIGGYHGKGKRTGTYGGFLLACYDNENEEFQSICKLGTGFKEDELEAHTKFLKNHVIKVPKSYYRFDHSLQPDEWFEPEQIWEVKCADLSISPIHKAAIGIVDPEKGISLRFPRFLRIRDDKKVEDATNSSQIADMYQKQDQVQNMKAKPINEEDYY